MTEFDPSEYIRGIQQILISDKKKIGFLFGAGTSLSQKNEKSLTVPAIGKMTEEIVKELGDKSTEFESALLSIKEELGKNNFNVETILTNLQQKHSIIGKGELNGLKKKGFENLIDKFKKGVRDRASVHIKDGKTVSNDIIIELVQADFANWIGQAERKFPIEIFTTNYDLLFELGLEYKSIPYYDGFIGSYKPFFYPESVENFNFLPQETKLWKIHGSLGWQFNKEKDRIQRLISDDNDILIYPSTLKYKDSKKQPYESLLDRLTSFLKNDDAILITCGYSWGDEHINSRIISALKTDTTSHVIGLIYDKYKDDEGKVNYSLTSENDLTRIGLNNPKISLYGARNAVIGCHFGKWKLKAEPSKDDTINLNLYYDEDAYTNLEEKTGVEKKGEEDWTGEGELTLIDFKKLVLFLNSMVTENVIKKMGENGKK